MKKRELIVATGNQGKLKEIRELLSDLEITVRCMKDIWEIPPEIEENGATFFQNAAIKADWVFGETGIWTLADDSGLCVDALGGKPGVKSARFAGEHGDTKANNLKLLSLLSEIPNEKRTARFVCATVVRINEEIILKAEGSCEGKISFRESGSNGFGYDPLFYPDGYDQTMAEISNEEKNSISHRGKALQKIKEMLHGYLTD